MASNRNVGDGSLQGADNINCMRQSMRTTTSVTNKTNTGKKPSQMSAEQKKFEQRFALLTPRELLVLQGISEGKTTTMIAEQLDIGELTIETYKHLIMLKFDVGSTAELTHIVVDALP